MVIILFGVLGLGHRRIDGRRFGHGVNLPVPKAKNPEKNVHQAKPKDSPAVAKFELGMPSVGPPADAHPAPLRRATAVDVSGAAPTGLPLGGPGTRVPETDGSAGSGGAAVGPGVSEQQLEAAREAALAAQAAGTIPDFRWLIASDVCKHCTHAGCLDVCPTGSLFRTEFGTVVVSATASICPCPG